MKAAVCYEIVNASGEHPKYYFKNPPKIVERFYIKWNRLGGARQYSFEFNFYHE